MGSSSALKIGIIGTGHGLRTLKPSFEFDGRAEVVAVSGSSMDRARSYASEYGIELVFASSRELCSSDEVDLVCVASPNEFHVLDAINAVDSHKHVYLEKPVGCDHQEAERILAQARKSDTDRIIVVGHQLRFNPYIQEIRSWIMQGSLGHVYLVRIDQRGGAFARQDKPWTWEFDENAGGGVRLAMGTHLVDTASFLVGRQPEELTSSAHPVHKHRPSHTGETRTVAVSNYYSAEVDFGDAFSQVSTSAASHGPGRFEIEVLGSEGSAHYDGGTSLQLFRDSREVPSAHSIDADAYLSRPGSSVFRKSMTYLASEILDSIERRRDQVDTAHTLEDAVELMRLLDSSNHKFEERYAGSRMAF